MPVSLMFKIFGMFDTHTKGSVNLVVVLPLLARQHQLKLVGRTLLLLLLVMLLPVHLHLLPMHLHLQFLQILQPRSLA